MFEMTNEYIIEKIKECNAIIKEVYKDYVEPDMSGVKPRMKMSQKWGSVRVSRVTKAGSKTPVKCLDFFLNLKLNYTDEQGRLNTIMHECIHLQPGCHGHGSTWQNVCYLVMKKYPQFKLSRLTSVAEKISAEAQREINQVFHERNRQVKSEYIYEIYCKKCGQVVGRYTRFSRIFKDGGRDNRGHRMEDWVLRINDIERARPHLHQINPKLEKEILG